MLLDCNDVNSGLKLPDDQLDQICEWKIVMMKWVSGLNDRKS